MKPKTRTDYVKEAAWAMSDLHMFAAVMAIMESSLVTSNCHPAEARIVTICKQETSRALARYDRALAAANS